ncbi:endonuclease domain-containing protein [Synergistes jonesii]|uniref:endonuclease domain-containing protein n=1 Tax=Synergistes jonesii TaxID=2754 RepID=UPI00248DA59D|nr:DUF559 domain-containing protein [Synergistes jonesii]
MQMQSGPEIISCSECKAPIQWGSLSKTKKGSYYRSGHVYCSEKCKTAFLRRLFSITMARTNRIHASARMKSHNPMFNPETRAKMATTLRRIGHKPRVQGGNGRGMTKAQSLLMEHLSKMNPVSEFIAKTGETRLHPSHYPAHYKIDIAIPAHMLAIEVDGRSHNSLCIREKDLKKEIFLKSKGWTLLRFSNKEILENPSICAETVMSTILKLTA